MINLKFLNDAILLVGICAVVGISWFSISIPEILSNENLAAYNSEREIKIPIFGVFILTFFQHGLFVGLILMIFILLKFLLEMLKSNYPTVESIPGSLLNANKRWSYILNFILICGPVGITLGTLV